MTMITLPLRAVALLARGFDIAGDGGFDPFDQDQRAYVDNCLSEHEDALDREYAAMQEQERAATAQRQAEAKAQRRRLLKAELARLGDD